MTRRRQAAAVLLAVLVVGVYLIEQRTPNPDVAEDREHPIGEDERFVAAKLLDNIQGARPVCWGPHITREEVERYDWPGGLRPDAALRVVFLFRNAGGALDEYDWVFSVIGERVGFYGYNDFGDVWKERARLGNWPRNPPSPPNRPMK